MSESSRTAHSTADFRLVDGVAAGVVAGFAGGLGRGGLDVAANGHLGDRMLRSAAMSLQTHVDGMLIGAAGVAILLAVLWRLFRGRREPSAALAAGFLVLLAAATLADRLLAAFTSYTFAHAFRRLAVQIGRLAAGRISAGELAGFFPEHAAAAALVPVALAALVVLWRLAAGARWVRRCPGAAARLEGIASAVVRVAGPGRLRRTAAAALAFAALLHAATAASFRLSTPAGPNVVVILSDTLRRDHVGAYGYARDTTPNLDRLAAASVVFANAFAPSSHTKASVASLFTSTYPSQHQAVYNEDALDRSYHTLAELLREAGYRTAAFTENPVLAREFRFDQGFTDWETDYRRHESLSDEPMDDFDRRIHLWLEAHRAERFALYVHYIDPHDPYRAPPAFRGTLEEAAGSDARSRRLHAYDEEIRYVDSRVGALVERLAGIGVLDDTLLVFLSDHGEGFGAPDRVKGHANSVYGEVIDVPLIVRYPKLGAAREARAASLVDVLPTIAAMAGLVPQPGWQGRNLFDGASGTAVFSEQLLREHDRRVQRCIIRDGWKLVHDLDSGKDELYRIADDPGESNDLAAPQAAVADRLKGDLAGWLASLGERKEVVKVELSPERRDQLRALGYVQ